MYSIKINPLIVNPNIKTGISRIISTTISSMFKSLFLIICLFTGPKLILLNIHIEYIVVKNVPDKATKLNQGFIFNIEKPIKTSPIILTVPGVLKLAKISKKKQTVNIGDVLASPDK